MESITGRLYKCLNSVNGKLGAYRESKDAGNPDGTPERIEASEDHLWLIRVSHSHTEGSQEWSPTHLHTHT